MQEDTKKMWLAVAWLAALICAFALFSGCSAPKTITVTEYRDRVQIDTLRRVDSVYVSHYVMQRGDTVHVTDTIRDYKIIRETAEVVVRDSIPYPVEVVKEVPVRTKWDKFATWVVLAIVVYLLMRLLAWLVTLRL